MIRCDEPMREKKIEAAKRTQTVTQWRCTGVCSHCICGLKKTNIGTWEHIYLGSAKYDAIILEDIDD